MHEIWHFWHVSIYCIFWKKREGAFIRAGAFIRINMVLFLFYYLALTHCILVDSSTVICWMCPFVVLGVASLFCVFYSAFDGKSC